MPLGSRVTNVLLVWSSSRGSVSWVEVVEVRCATRCGRCSNPSPAPDITCTQAAHTGATGAGQRTTRSPPLPSLTTSSSLVAAHRQGESLHRMPHTGGVLRRDADEAAGAPEVVDVLMCVYVHRKSLMFFSGLRGRYENTGHLPPSLLSAHQRDRASLAVVHSCACVCRRAGTGATCPSGAAPSRPWHRTGAG